MELEYIDINGYGVLVGDCDDCITNGHRVWRWGIESSTLLGRNKVIFAEKELNLDVPVLNWRGWDVEKLAEKYADFSNDYIPLCASEGRFNETSKRDFINGYNSNKAKYTEEDLRKAFYQGYNVGVHLADYKTEEECERFIKSLQRTPKYMIVESIYDNPAKIVEIIY